MCYRLSHVTDNALSERTRMQTSRLVEWCGWDQAGIVVLRFWFSNRIPSIKYIPVRGCERIMQGLSLGNALDVRRGSTTARPEVRILIHVVES